MKKVFIETENVQEFNDICNELSQPDLVGPSLALVTGRAGRGKTQAAMKYVIETNAIRVLLLQSSTPVKALRDIAFELSMTKPRTTDGCLEVIAGEMRKERRLILADEADLVPLKTLEMLRQMNELCGCPIVFIGEEDLATKIVDRRRIVSRIRRRMAFGPMTPSNLSGFYQESLDIKLTSPVIGIFHRYSKGDWRPAITCMIALNRALEASDTKEVSEEMAREIVRNEEIKNRAHRPA